MNSREVTRQSPTEGIAAWVGLDWADQQHVICLYEVAKRSKRNHPSGAKAGSLPELAEPVAPAFWRCESGDRFGASARGGDLCSVGF